MKRLACWLLVAVFALVGSAALAQDKPVVGLVMKSLGNPFFKTMEDGAVQHVKERGDLQLIALGIQNETDLQAQIGLVENLMARNVDAIVVAPADSRALVPVLVRAIKQGIVVINIDVRLNQQALADAGVNIPYVGPDNAAAAKMSGDVCAKALGPGAKVIILTGIPGADNAVQRQKGFEEAAQEGKLDVVATQTAHWETDEAYSVTANLLTAHPDVKGILSSNDDMSIGAARAVQSAGLADQIKICSFDNIDAIHPLMKSGLVISTIDQFAAKQAGDGIDIAMDMLAGKEHTGWVKIPVQLVTPADL